MIIEYYSNSTPPRVVQIDLKKVTVISWQVNNTNGKFFINYKKTYPNAKPGNIKSADASIYLPMGVLLDPATVIQYMQTNYKTVQKQ